jgi:hypothetical protein
MTSERLNNHYSIFTIKSSPNCQFSKLMLFMYCPGNYKNNINFIHVNRIFVQRSSSPAAKEPLAPEPWHATTPQLSPPAAIISSWHERCSVCRSKMRHLVCVCLHEGRAARGARDLVATGGMSRQPVESMASGKRRTNARTIRRHSSKDSRALPTNHHQR